MNKKLLPFIIILFVLFKNHAQTTKLSYTDAISIADKQRMLIQQMAKNKLFIEVNSRVNESEKDLKNNILEFELALEVLKDFAPNDDAKLKLEVQELIFKSYKKLLLETTKKSMNEVISMNTLFLRTSNTIFEDFIINFKSEFKINNKLTKNLLKASGTLKYMAQRISLYHTIHHFKIKTIYPEEINAMIKKTDNALNYLTISEFNTLDIDDALSKVLYYWTDLKLKMNKSGKSKSGISKINPELLYDLSNIVSNKSLSITDMYIKLLK